jgi:heme-degrading monooxygenase HmoA
MITLLNVFHVEPSRQHELLEVLARTTDETMSRFPGFISATFHASLDGARVFNYAQWRSREDFENMLADPVSRQIREVARAIFSRDEPQLYTVASVHHPRPGTEPA